jgi:hypothetical protein
MRYHRSEVLPYRKRLGIYKSASGKVSFDPDTFEARSYGWWIFVKRIKGKVVFNSAGYSVTTAKHQRQVRELLSDLGILIDLEVQIGRGLQEFESQAIPSLQYQIDKLTEKLANGRPAKNAERLQQIRELEEKIALCKLLGAHGEIENPSIVQVVRRLDARMRSERRPEVAA